MFRRRNIFEDPIRHRRWVHGPSGKNLMLRVPMGKDINTYIPRELRENRFPMGLLNPRGAPVHYWGVNKWGPPGSGDYRKWPIRGLDMPTRFQALPVRGHTLMPRYNIR